MARIRTIKPDFWTDEKIVELSEVATLLFIGLWNFADDSGRMEYSPIRIKLQILPTRDIDCVGLLGELAGHKLITIYEVDGKKYIQINNFDKHQKIDKRTPSKFPQLPPTSPESPRLSPKSPDGMEGKGREKETPKGDVSAKAALWSVCREYLGDSTMPLVGKWVKEHGETKVFEVVVAAQKQNPADPKSYIAASLTPKKAKFHI